MKIKYDLSIQADKNYAGKLVVQNGDEEELIKGIKEIIDGIHMKETHLAKINIWRFEE